MRPRDAGAREAGYVSCACRSRSAPIFKDWLLRALSRPLPACHVADPLDARRQGLRCRVGQADEGQRPLCLADRPALRDRRAAARPQHEKRALRTDLFKPTGTAASS